MLLECRCWTGCPVLTSPQNSVPHLCAFFLAQGWETTNLHDGVCVPEAQQDSIIVLRSRRTCGCSCCCFSQRQLTTEVGCPMSPVLETWDTTTAHRTRPTQSFRHHATGEMSTARDQASIFPDEWAREDTAARPGASLPAPDVCPSKETSCGRFPRGI
jgi:hypothetical protein